MSKMTTFEDMDLRHSLLKGIYAKGYEKPAYIQQKLIIPTIEGRDIIAQAQSGMGKTGFFTIGILQNINPDIKDCQALIVLPTRELANQTQKMVTSMSQFMTGIQCICLTGGSVEKVGEQLQGGAQIVVGTPGRIIHMVEEEYLNLSHLKTLVLDEADKLLDDIDLTQFNTNKVSGNQSKQLATNIKPAHPFRFDAQLNLLRKYLSHDIQTILTSATMRSGRLEVYKDMVKYDPVIVMLKNEMLTLEGISQYFIDTNSKIITLMDLFGKLKNYQTLIFCNTRAIVKFVSEQFRDYPEVSQIQGGMHQRKRDTIFRKFLSGEIRILITSDLMSRGIDVQQVSVVVNFQLPQINEDYIHRVGRAGRYGRKGLAINLISGVECDKLDEIQKFYSAQIKQIDVPELNILNFDD